jgi:hypothetical protein
VTRIQSEQGGTSSVFRHIRHIGTNLNFLSQTILHFLKLTQLFIGAKNAKFLKKLLSGSAV